jgi:hypothetical protein
MSGTKVLGLAAVSAFLLMAAPISQSQAASLINPGSAATVHQDSAMVTQVGWHHHWHHHWHRRWHRWHR